MMNLTGKNNNYPKMPKRVKKESGFFYLWSAIFIKWGIATVVTMIAMGFYEAFAIVKESGVDPMTIETAKQFQDVLMAYYSQGADQYSEFVREVTMQFMQYTTPIEGVAAALTIPIIILMYRNDCRRRLQKGFVQNKRAPLWMYIGIIVLSCSLSLGIDNLLAISHILVVDEAYVEVTKMLYHASAEVQILCLGILVPICEELVFRGMLFKRMTQSATFFRSAMYSSFIFAVFHGTTVQIFSAFFLGMTFCYLYEKYGSLKAPILAHASANIFSIGINQVHLLDKLVKDDFVISVVTIASAFVAAVTFVLIRRIQEKPEVIEEI